MWDLSTRQGPYCRSFGNLSNGLGEDGNDSPGDIDGSDEDEDDDSHSTRNKRNQCLYLVYVLAFCLVFNTHCSHLSFSKSMVKGESFPFYVIGAETEAQRC